MYSSRSGVVLLLWFVAPGVVCGFLSWLFGSALFAVWRHYDASSYKGARIMLPILLAACGISGWLELRSRPVAPTDAVTADSSREAKLVTAAPLISAFLGAATGILVALYEVRPDTDSSRDDPLGSRSAKHFLTIAAFYLGSILLAWLLVSRLR